MNPAVRNILAIIAGVIVGSVVNIGILKLSPHVVALPNGIDPMDVENLKANIHLFEAKHFLMPFLAHAIGTLAGAYMAARFATGNKMRAAIIVGIIFLIGGFMTAMDLGTPMWMNIVDIVAAYIPMAYLGGHLASRQSAS